MNFFYLNNNNEKVQIDLKNGNKWSDIKIESEQLNSIFSKVDDGDDIISDKELDVFKKILDFADNIIKHRAKDGIIENEELDEVLKQYNNGNKIVLNAQNELVTQNFLPQTLSVMTKNGTKITFSDNYNRDIIEELEDPLTDKKTEDFGKVIFEKDNKKYEMIYSLDNCLDRDIIDHRKVRAKVAQYLSNLPEETLEKLMDDNIKYLHFDNTLLGQDLQKLFGKNEFMDFTGDIATISSTSFEVPKRDYKQAFHIKNENNIEFEIHNNSETSSVITITLNSGKSFKINVQGQLKDEYNQLELPKLINLLKDLPESVLTDLSNEVSDVKFLNNSADMDAAYILNTNQICFKHDSRTISFVHELGHAIDNQNKKMLSNNPVFKEDFEVFTTLLKEILPEYYNHACDLPEEFFASYYAYKKLPSDASASNHLADLDKTLSKFENSDNIKEQQCYKIFEKLKTEAENLYQYAHKQDSSQKLDSSINDLVKTNCEDLILKSEKHFGLLSKYLQTQFLELEMICCLTSDDKVFESRLEYYEQLATNTYEYSPGKYSNLPNELRELFNDMQIRLKELRAEVSKEKETTTL